MIFPFVLILILYAEYIVYNYTYVKFLSWHHTHLIYKNEYINSFIQFINDEYWKIKNDNKKMKMHLLTVKIIFFK